MTAALRKVAPADGTDGGVLLWGGASVPIEAPGTNPLAEQSPNAGATAAMTPGQSSDSSVAPSNCVSEAARQLGKRGGRPRGSYSPLTIWLRGVVKELRRENFTCRQTFYRIGVAEEMDDDEQGFTVTAETSDFVWRECFGDIAGKRVTWETFRKLWQKT